MTETVEQCRRCGECCMKSSPTLQPEDTSLITEGVIPRQDLYTIRQGELVWDPVASRPTRAEAEMVKVKEKPEGKGCMYYDEGNHACTIYERRPAQCAAFACWDVRPFMKLYAGGKAARKDMISNQSLVSLMAEHEKKCSYDGLEDIVKRIETEGKKAVQYLLELLKLDYYVRPSACERFNLDMKEMDFFFGRPLIETVSMFGLKVIRESDGSFFLTVDA